MNCLSIRFSAVIIAALPLAAASTARATSVENRTAEAAARAAANEERLIAVLKSKLPAVEKNKACRELKLIGTEKSIPALAALLTDKDLHLPARFALESMSYPAAGAAMREAVAKASGKARAGLIDSLGERRDAAAVAVIAPALADADKQVVAAAAWALGKIGTEDAATALFAARKKATGESLIAIGQGLVLCARNLVRANKRDDGVGLFMALTATDEAKNVRRGALAGVVRWAMPKDGLVVREFMAKGDAMMRAAAAAALPDLPTDDLAKVAADLQKLPVPSQVSILSAVRIRGDRKLLDVALSGLTSPSDEVRLAAVRALGSAGDSAALPKLLALAAKGGPAADAARQSIAAIPGKDVDAKIVSLLHGEKNAKRRAEYIGIVAARRSAGAAAVLLEEAKYPDAAVRGRAMAELTPLASPKDLSGLIEGVLAAQPAEERNAAERTIVRVMLQIHEPEKRAELVLAAIDSSSGDRLALLPLAGRFGGKTVAGIIESDLAGPDAHVKQLALRALCNWPDASVADELLHREETCADPADRAMLLRAYIRVVSLPKQGSDAVRLERLKRAMSLAQHDEERSYILERAGAVRTLDSLRFILPYVDRPAVAESACKAVAELAHHRELRDPHKAEFQAALEKVQRTSKDRLILENVKRYLDAMHGA